MGRVVSVSLGVVIGLTLLPGMTAAQGTSAASVTGVVRDTTGGVLPGVTVEASSPALIEKVRSTVTDDQGRYTILELRPGTYTVTFTLQGFSVLKRDGLELTSNFTATVNAELKVGELQETITVSGQTPLVDVQNLTQQKTISSRLLASVPTNRTILGIAALIPAVVQPPNAQDVGGSKGERSVRITVHGGKTFDSRLLQDGMRYNALTPGLPPPLGASGLEGVGRGYYVNPLASNEIVIDIGTMGSAEYSLGGAQVNSILKDGGNRLSGSFFVGGTGHQLQADNLTSELQAQGLRSVNTVRKVHDVNLFVGGPISKDRLWFTSSARRWGTTTSVANLFRDANISARVPGAPAAVWRYAPDFSTPVYPEEIDKHFGFRLTYQATSKDKVSFSHDRQKNFQEQLIGQLETGTIKAEGNGGYCQPHRVTQGTWTRPASNRLLFEAGVTVSQFRFSQFGNDLFLSDFIQCGIGIPDNVSINDVTLGYTYNGTGNRAKTYTDQSNGRFSTSLITGSHNIRMGVFWMYGLGGGHRTYTDRNPAQVNGLPVAYTFNNGTPVSLTQYATPLFNIYQLNPDLGLFVQDQWLIKRLTVNAGLRFDWVRQSVPALTEPAGPLVPARSFQALDNVPNWKDLNPRFGVVWDPFGDNKTAVKAGINRYIQSATTGVASVFAPVNASVDSTTRSWTDSNANFLPDCDLRSPIGNGECGPMTNANFGRAVPNIRPDPDWITGWGKRPYDWQLSVSVDREVLRGVQVSAGYYRTWYSNFPVIDNLEVTPADYSPYCVTVPSDPRLPGSVSGQQICGLWDINPDKFGRVTRLATFAKSFGSQTEIYNGVDATFQVRRNRLILGGGWNIGNSVQLGTTAGGSATASSNTCFVVDSPQQLYNCDVRNPYQSRVKINGSYELPWQDIQLAFVAQTNPGPTYNTLVTFTTAQVATSLGRPLSGGTRTVTINVVPPFSQFGDRINQLDVRAAKTFRLGPSLQLQANVDVYNVFNASAVLNIISTFGPLYRQPTQILDARLVRFSVQVDF